MLTTQEFDLIKSALAGKNLIEASAGTGKTFAITALFLRLLLEKGLTVDEILVVTFTEAATNELKDRIRNMLQTAKKGFSSGRSEDSFLNDFIKQQTNLDAARRLNDAIRDFDEAAIFTIHGFCNKVLQEHAFESAGLFDTELVTEQTALLRQIVEDFWRRHLYRETGLFVSYAISEISPNTLLDLLVDKIGLPYLEIIPKVAQKDSSVQEEQFVQSFHEVRRLWPSAKEEISRILHDSRMKRNLYKEERIPAWIKAMDTYIASDNANPVLFSGFEKFTSASIRNGVRKGYLPLSHHFFDACEQHYMNYTELERVYKERLIALKTELFDYARKELTKRKQEKNIYFFDDLLLNLRSALTDDGNNLARTIRTKFKAALIDEFQDTDPVQYEIFKKIFDHEDSILFLIGDPKQAIYGFRGADVFAYMQAKSEIKTHYTLSTNYRSDPKLISSINTLFENADSPFLYDEIPFQKAFPPAESSHDRFQVMEDSDAPLQLWFIDASKINEFGKALSKPQARELITKSVASEIARLLNLGRSGKALLGDQPVEEKDIAVLVRTNAEARQVQQALTNVNVHSVLYSSANLFESDEATELQRILAAAVEPKRHRLLRTALTTEVLGVRAEELFDLVQNEDDLEAWFDKFATYHKLWQKHGFIRMFKHMMIQEKLLPRLMSYPDGERRITNLLHLAEVLNQAASDQELGMSGLLKWLSERRTTRIAPAEEHQLRLESDENAVKLVTMHMSKGLEYPVVFCPFTWSGSIIRNANILKFHDEKNDRTFTLDLGSEKIEQNKVFAEKEELAENLRLLYVAVTRAKNRCYLVWGRFNEGDSSAPAYLFHQPKLLDASDVVTNLRKYVKNFDDVALRKDLEKISAVSSETIYLADMPSPGTSRFFDLSDSKKGLTCREFTANIDASERISSYSSLVSGHPYGAELADYDAIDVGDVHKERPEEAKPEEPFSNVLFFPRGTKTGTFIHDVFQNLDYTRPSSRETRELVRSKLQEYGFEAEWMQAVCDMIQRVLSTAIGFPEPSFSLSQISTENRLNELEFYFPSKSLSPLTLKDVFMRFARVDFSEEFPNKIAQLNFANFKGFMKGFIDLVFQFEGRFYLADWKTNYLGSDIQHYGQRALAGTMVENLYLLQYHIYTVALNRYLKLRIPDYSYESHFGGVFYIFLRGVDPSVGTDFGIYKARPSEKIVEELSDYLIDSIA